MINGKIDQQHFIDLARSEKATINGPWIEEFMPAIHVLREEKNWTWSEIQNWLKRKAKANYSEAHISMSYKKWRAR